MNLVGKWEVSAVTTWVGDDLKWATREEASRMEDCNLSIFDTVMEFTDSGEVRTLARIPAGMSQEELDEARAQGEEIDGDFFVGEKHPWKEENGKIFYHTGAEGTFLDEEVSPWDEIIVEENGEITVLGMMRMKRM